MDFHDSPMLFREIGEVERTPPKVMCRGTFFLLASQSEWPFCHWLCGSSRTPEPHFNGSVVFALSGPFALPQRSQTAQRSLRDAARLYLQNVVRLSFQGVSG